MMKYLKKFTIKNYYLIALFMPFILSCEKEKVAEDYVAKVNDVILSENELEDALDSKFHDKKYKDEYIRQWVETELLYQEAVENDITDEPEYKSVLEQSRKQLAVSFLLKEYYKDWEADYGVKELKSYFNKYINDFKIFDDAYVLNIADFNDESRAILFRYTLIESDWNSALSVFHNDESILDTKSNQLYYRYQIRPIMLYRAIKNLLPSETSIVLQTEPGIFTVVQLVTSLEKNSFPNYEYVEGLVKERYEVTLKTELYRNFIEELFVKHNVKFKKDYE